MPYMHRTDKIVDYDDWVGWADRGYTFRDFVVRFYGEPLPDAADIQPEIATAYVSEGRWVADCPVGCGGALIVTPSDLLFLCVDCGSGWHRIIFPTPGDKAQIEHLLMQRPLGRGKIPSARNWHPAEQTISELRDENIARGID